MPVTLTLYRKTPQGDLASEDIVFKHERSADDLIIKQTAIGMTVRGKGRTVCLPPGEVYRWEMVEGSSDSPTAGSPDGNADYGLLKVDKDDLGVLASALRKYETAHEDDPDRRRVAGRLYRAVERLNEKVR